MVRERLWSAAAAVGRRQSKEEQRQDGCLEKERERDKGEEKGRFPASPPPFLSCLSLSLERALDLVPCAPGAPLLSSCRPIKKLIGFLS